MTTASRTEAPPAAAPRGSAAAGLAALAVAVPVALIAALLTGALEPAALSDPGPVTRVATVVVRTVHDLAAALTIGLLLVAAFLTPESRRSRRREFAARSAALAGAVWATAAAAGMVLAFATAAGQPPVGQPFYTLLWQNFWSLDLTRMLTLETLFAGLVALAALVSRSRMALAWTFALALVALVPLSFTGHAGADEGHEQAVNSLLVHLVAACLWVGGLTAIIVMRRHLGSALAVTVRRYSTVALWCYVAIAVSGVLFALLQVGTLADLVSPYWLVIWAKVAALAALGVFGAVHRRRIIRGGLDRPHAFTRLAIAEIVVMGVAFGLAVALSRTAPPVVPTPGQDVVVGLTGFPEPAPFEPALLATAWRVDWLFLAVTLLAVGLYLVGVNRMRRRGDRWPVGRTVAWVVGWAIFLYLTNGAPGIYGRLMFSMHMVQHMGLMMLAPIPMVLGAPITLALRTLKARKDRTLGPREILMAVIHSRWARFVGNPVVAGGIFFGSLVIFYWTDIFGWVLTSHVGHLGMTVHFLMAGYLFVWTLIGVDPGPPKWPAPLRLVVLFGTLAAHAFFGLALMQGRWLLAPEVFLALDLDWVPDLLADQQLGGTIAWGVGELPTFLLALLVTVDWVRSDRRETTRVDRQADRDDDAALVAYNARLQSLSARSRPAPSAPPDAPDPPSTPKDSS